MELKDLEISGIEIMDLKDATALPETGASAGSSGCSACSTCGSCSCCSSCF